MSYGQSLLAEFDQEMATTRRLLERVPTDKGSWKPHPKSFALGHLAQLVATMPGWNTRTLRDGAIDLSSAPGYRLQPTESLVAQFDQLVREARAAIAETTDAEMKLPFRLTMGDRVLFETSRGDTLRQNLNHLYHHRGQLTVYLRELDVPLPSIYGPTADEPWGGSGG